MSVMEMMNLATSCGQRFRRARNGRALISSWRGVPGTIYSKLLSRWDDVSAVVAEHSEALNPEASVALIAAQRILSTGE